MRILIAKNAHTKTLKEKIIWAAPAESGALLNIELAGTTFPDAEYRIARGGTSFFVIEAVFAFHQGVATHQKIVHGGLQGGRIVRPFPADLLFVKDDLHLFHVGSFHLLVAV